MRTLQEAQFRSVSFNPKRIHRTLLNALHTTDAGRLDQQLILHFLIVITLAAFLSYFSTIKIGSNIHRILAKLDYLKICITVLAGSTLMSLLFTGLFELMIFMIAIPLDVSAFCMKIRRSHSMRRIVLLIVLCGAPIVTMVAD